MFLRKSWEPHSRPFHKLILHIDVLAIAWNRFRQLSFKLRPWNDDSKALWKRMNEEFFELKVKVIGRGNHTIEAMQLELIAETSTWGIANSYDVIIEALEFIDANRLASPVSYSDDDLLPNEVEDPSKWLETLAARREQYKRFEQQGENLRSLGAIRTRLLALLASRQEGLTDEVRDRRELYSLSLTNPGEEERVRQDVLLGFLQEAERTNGFLEFLSSEESRKARQEALQNDFNRWDEAHTSSVNVFLDSISKIYHAEMADRPPLTDRLVDPMKWTIHLLTAGRLIRENDWERHIRERIIQDSPERLGYQLLLAASAIPEQLDKNLSVLVGTKTLVDFTWKDVANSLSYFFHHVQLPIDRQKKRDTIFGTQHEQAETGVFDTMAEVDRKLASERLHLIEVERDNAGQQVGTAPFSPPAHESNSTKGLMILPVWDSETLRLSYGDWSKTYKKNATNQLPIFEAFHRSGWLSEIKNPLTRANLTTTIRDLNKSLGDTARIAFRANGNGTRIIWVRLEKESPSNSFELP